MNDWINVISAVGFPIFMCAWFMFRMETVIKNNTAALLKVIEKINSS